MSLRLDNVLAIAIRAVIIVTLLAPLVVTEKTLFPYVVGKALWIRSLIEIAFALWVVLALRNERYGLPRSWLISLFILYILVCLISAILGASFQRSFWGDVRRMGGVFDLAHWFLFLVVVASMWRTSRDWRWLLNVNLGLSLLLGVLGIFQNFGVSLLWYLKQTGRVDATLGNADYVGAYTLVNALVALAFLIHSFAPKPLSLPDVEPGRRQTRRAPRRTQDEWVWVWRGFWAATISVNLFVLTLSGTRGAAAGLVAALFVGGVAYGVFGTRKRLRIATAAASVLALAAVLLLPVAHDAGLMKPLASANPLFRRLDETFAGGIAQAYETRRVIVEAGLAAFPDSLNSRIFGWGPENFAVAYDRYGTGYFGEQIADQAHSKPVEELTTKGIVGLALYLAMIGYSLWVIYRKLKREPQEEFLTLGLGVAFVGYVAQNLFLFDTPGTFLQFALLLAWVATNEYPAQAQAAQLEAQTAATRRERRAALAAAQDRQEAQARQATLGKALRTPSVAATISVVVVALAALSLYFTVFRAYSMAASFPVQGQTLDGYYKDAKASFAQFPPLATLPRVFLLDTLAANWQAGKGSLDLLNQVVAEGEIAIDSEPKNARIYISLANLVQAAAPQNTELLKESRKLVDKARELGPNLPSLTEAERRQAEMERQFGAS